MIIAQLTSVHSPTDVRIYGKISSTLVKAGHEVHIVAPCDKGVGQETLGGVVMHYLPVSQNRIRRVLKLVGRVLKVAAALKVDIYHFHDPDFLPYAPFFQHYVGRPVIYDAHEDVRLNLLSRTWLSPVMRKPFAFGVGLCEDMVIPRLAGVIAATPAIARRLTKSANQVMVQNFPLLDELARPRNFRVTESLATFVYAGGISSLRGVQEAIQALPLAGADARLALAGQWSPESWRSQCMEMEGWNQVDEKGFLDRPALAELLNSAVAGLVLYHPTQAHLEAYPNKLFEYMSAGLPVIASNFPLWRGIVEETGCGLLADPLNPEDIARAMQWMLDHPEEAAAMGRRGRKAVEERFNWESEASKLIAFYEKLLGNRQVKRVVR